MSKTVEGHGVWLDCSVKEAVANGLGEVLGTDGPGTHAGVGHGGVGAEAGRLDVAGSENVLAHLLG